MNTVIDESRIRAVKLAASIKYVGVTFLAAIVANLIFLGMFRESPLVYAVVPFNLAYIICVAWLARVAYGWFMAAITILLVIFPVGIFIIMLLSYSRASKELKVLGYKSGFTGKLVEI